MKDKTFTKLYDQFLETGEMSNLGLCNVVHSIERNGTTFDSHYEGLLALIRPTDEDLYALVTEGYDSIFWGSGYKEFAVLNVPILKLHKRFTPLRQTLLLLLAALNDEFDE